VVERRWRGGVYISTEQEGRIPDIYLDEYILQMVDLAGADLAVQAVYIINILVRRLCFSQPCGDTVLL